MKKKKPIVKYKNLQIYFDLNDNKFKADDKITGETFESMYLWDVYNKIDHPIYKEAEEVLGYHSSLTEVYEVISKKINLRTGKRVFDRLNSNRSLATHGTIVIKNKDTEQLYLDYLKAHNESNLAWRRKDSLVSKIAEYKEIKDD